MAVYTEVSFDEAAALIDGLGIGALQALAPCAGGIENTNYFADTASGRYVLTVFERLGADELPFYLALMKHLAERDLPVPRPHAGSDGVLLLALKGKPAAVVDRLPGEHHLAPDAGDCASVGSVLARMHLATRDFAPAQPNLRGLAWWNATVPAVVGHLDPAAAAMMQDELDYQRHLAAAPAYATLPRGAIHGDLFRDNVMFQEGALTGVFDFYFAGVDTLLYDIAVALNDWCSDPASGELDEDRAGALVAAYAALRPLESAEVRLLPALMRAAAFRFWLARLGRDLPRDAVVDRARPRTFRACPGRAARDAVASAAERSGRAMKLQLVRRGAAWSGCGRRSRSSRASRRLRGAVRGLPVRVPAARPDPVCRHDPAADPAAGGLAAVHDRDPARDRGQGADPGRHRRARARRTTAPGRAAQARHRLRRRDLLRLLARRRPRRRCAPGVPRLAAGR
jgi:homoserine kinase type II